MQNVPCRYAFKERSMKFFQEFWIYQLQWVSFDSEHRWRSNKLNFDFCKGICLHKSIWCLQKMYTSVLRSGAQVDWPPLLTRQTGRILHGKNITMTDIRTLVYFDLEATGLKSSGKPRICELSLLAVNIQDVLDFNMALIASLDNRRSEKDYLQVKNLSPRILNKLTLCVYPMATIVPLVSDLTGLDNYNLSGQSKFTKNTFE